MLKNLFGILFLSFGFTVSAAAQTAAPTKPKPNPQPVKKNAKPVAPVVKTEPFEKADVKTMLAQCVTLDTEAGKIELEMFPETAPETVRNFLNLAAMKIYDGTIFNRIVPNFVVQGGNVTKSETATYETVERASRPLRDEPNAVKHERGIVSMARGDEPHSASSHFFILVRDASFLDGKFAAFGRVTSGMEIVDAINKMPVKDEKPEKPVKVNKVIVAPCPVKTEG